VQCAIENTGDAQLFEKVKKNCPELKPEDLALLVSDGAAGGGDDGDGDEEAEE
jgi:hypothetical protein